MSSFYVLQEKEVDISTKAETSFVQDEVTKLKTLIKTEDDKIKKHSDDEDKKLLDLKATRSLEDDLSLNNNAIIGIDDINASNSVPSKGFVRQELAKKLNLTGGSVSGALTLLNVATCQTPTQNAHIANKKYVDDSSGGQQLCYNYQITFPATVYNSWVYGRGSFFDKPDLWMFIGSPLTDNSYFHFQSWCVDTDNSLPSTMPIEFRLQAFEGSRLRDWTFFSGNIKSYRIPGERFFVVDQKYYFKDYPGVSNYKQLTLCRLSIKTKWNTAFGNENRVGFSIVV